ncbi:hypothetical protein B296_00052162 [Ensete ventricosum]|uniref:Uncharacterized protein n=1 Tax=Ensete ventricosum TaxID=4639 RepID=A0A426YDJ3_ENSVE|nr:hypothetical protein B296_00052162 [Ensete ventricosum]
MLVHLPWEHRRTRSIYLPKKKKNKVYLVGMAMGFAVRSFVTPPASSDVDEKGDTTAVSHFAALQTNASKHPLAALAHCDEGF